jgi:serine protease Do
MTQGDIMVPRTLYPFLAILIGLSLFVIAKVNRTFDWQEAEEKAQNTVVQVCAQHTEFNWLEPYKAPHQQESSGTAFFINNEGYLLTNFHVVDQAKSLQLLIPALGQKPVDAHVVGVCPEADVAYIKLSDTGIKAVRDALKSIPFLKLGDSDALFPTEPVLALGYPLGQRYIKSTVGVIAGREYIDRRSFMHVTAPINPGNSGGPLLNLDGLVVGINSAGIPNAQNIGYIVPIYDAQILLKDLKKEGLVRKPWLGAYYNPTTDEHAQFLGNPLPAGVYINGVERDSLADKAGVKAGDMLYEINGYPVDSYGDVTVNWRSSLKVTLDEFLIRLPSTTKIMLRLYRNGIQKKIAFTYDELKPAPIRFIYVDHEHDALDYEVIGGMCVMQLRLNHLDYFQQVVPLHKYKLNKNQHQELLIITKILPGSSVHRVNCFYEGALLANVNGKPVGNLTQLREILKGSAKTGLIALESKEKIATVLSVDAMLNDEERLTRDFKFTSTPAMTELKKARSARREPVKKAD